MTATRKEKRIRVRKRRVIGFMFLILLLGTSIYGAYIYFNLSNTFETTASVKSEVKRTHIERANPINVLLLGVDGRPGETERGRTDTMVVASLNPKQRSTLLFNIPRDTYTEIVGNDTFDKINHAHAFGGTEMSIRTVESLLHTDIDYYVKMNMRGLVDLVDALGGITINNTFEFTYKDHFPEGELTLNGKEALNYVRMRKEDPEGDFGRQKRQQQVILSIVEKAMNPLVIAKAGSIANVMGDNLETNIPLSDAFTLLSGYKSAAETIERVSLEGDSEIMDGIYYYKLRQDSLTAVRQTLDEQQSF